MFKIRTIFVKFSLLLSFSFLLIMGQSYFYEDPDAFAMEQYDNSKKYENMLWLGMNNSQEMAEEFIKQHPINPINNQPWDGAMAFGFDSEGNPFLKVLEVARNIEDNLNFSLFTNYEKVRNLNINTLVAHSNANDVAYNSIVSGLIKVNNWVMVSPPTGYEGKVNSLSHSQVKNINIFYSKGDPFPTVIGKTLIPFMNEFTKLFGDMTIGWNKTPSGELYYGPKFTVYFGDETYPPPHTDKYVFDNPILYYVPEKSLFGLSWEAHSLEMQLQNIALKEMYNLFNGYRFTDDPKKMDMFESRLLEYFKNNNEAKDKFVTNWKEWIAIGTDLPSRPLAFIKGDPTFVQLSKNNIISRRGKQNFSSNILIAQISVPYKDSLVRGNVPVFGLAYGKDFKEYRVEYGKGKEPKDWILIKQSTVPQTKDVTPADLDDSADITIHGNLATWDTGLKSYVYLPDYPPDHPVDLNGIYTLRLVVGDKDGEKAEDRVTVEVGEAIPNAWGGIVKSKDKKVTLTIPEQSVMDSFRVISIKPAGEGLNVPLDKNRKLISNVYEFREEGERFTKDAVLEMEYPKEVLKGLNSNKLGIYGYNPKNKVWVYLKSIRNEKEKKLVTTTRELNPYYAIFASNLESEGSVIKPTSKMDDSVLKTAENIRTDGFYLVRETFEDGIGEWSNRDGAVGAMVSRDNTATPDGTYCLKLTKTNYGGNFASNVRRTPFDVREHPIVQFDYKIPPDIKINFMVKVNSRWYEIGFTGAPKELRNTRVNIADIGKIENVIADDKWHTARFNLYEMLRTKTGNHMVTKMIMADWNVGGYMKLKFGTNRQGATFYIDNFTIRKESSSGPRIDGGVLLIDNFDQKKEVNSLGGISNVFTDSVEGKVQLSYVGNDNDSKKGSYALQISYDVSQKGSFAGYMTQLRNLDIGEYKTLSFDIKGSKSGEMFKIGLKDRSGNESKVLVNDYLPQEIGTTWQRVAIPLVAFSNIKDWGAMENLSLAFENSIGSGEGAVLLDDIQFEKDLKSLVVNNFENDNDSNLLGGKSWTFSNGAAGINGGYEKDSSSKVYRLSYGGEIGDLFTYAGWTTQLQGIDVSQCKSVSLLIKGAAGGEEPNIYMDDGNFRWGVYINRYKPTTASWQKVTIPLKDFADYGVDLTHLEELQVVFEWERMSGAIYIDDIRFDCSGDKVKEK